MEKPLSKWQKRTVFFVILVFPIKIVTLSSQFHVNINDEYWGDVL
jgi:hypothetical protein